MESQCMKTIVIHLIDKSDFILSDHKTRWQSTLQIFAVVPAELARSEDCDFSCIKLALQKVSVSHKYKSCQETGTKLYYFHPRIIEGFWKTKKSLQIGLQELSYRNSYFIIINIAVGLEHKVLLTDFNHHTYSWRSEPFCQSGYFLRS